MSSNFKIYCFFFNLIKTEYLYVHVVTYIGYLSIFKSERDSGFLVAVTNSIILYFCLFSDLTEILVFLSLLHNHCIFVFFRSYGNSFLVVVLVACSIILYFCLFSDLTEILVFLSLLHNHCIFVLFQILQRFILGCCFSCMFHNIVYMSFSDFAGILGWFF